MLGATSFLARLTTIKCLLVGVSKLETDTTLRCSDDPSTVHGNIIDLIGSMWHRLIWPIATRHGYSSKKEMLFLLKDVLVSIGNILIEF